MTPQGHAERSTYKEWRTLRPQYYHEDDRDEPTPIREGWRAKDFNIRLPAYDIGRVPSDPQDIHRKCTHNVLQKATQTWGNWSEDLTKRQPTLQKFCGLAGIKQETKKKHGSRSAEIEECVEPLEDTDRSPYMFDEWRRDSVEREYYDEIGAEDRRLNAQKNQLLAQGKQLSSMPVGDQRYRGYLSSSTRENSYHVHLLQEGRPSSYHTQTAFDGILR